MKKILSIFLLISTFCQAQYASGIFASKANLVNFLCALPPTPTASITMIKASDGPVIIKSNYTTLNTITTSGTILAGTASSVSTFNCIGLYWSGSGGSSSTVCTVQYRVSGTSTWNNAQPLWFDSRSVGGRPSNEYRGSIVGLQPGTSYDVQLTAGASTILLTSVTWSENFPIGATVNVASSTSTLNITTGGTATGYRLYTTAPGQTSIINVGTASNSGNATNCVYINAPYVILRGLTLLNAGEDAIRLGPNAHDVVIENNDISGWGYIGEGGNDQAAVRTKGFSENDLGVERIIIQRNKIHDSRDNSNSWDAGGHPLGPNGINFEHAGGNHVIRYNEIYTTVAGKKFMDGIGGADNFTYDGFPNANSDIYGNLIKNVYDDAIESEGGNCNVRIWGNFTDDTFTGIATATNSVGPMYIFRNITNMSVRSPYGASAGTIDNEDRGPFNKCGSQDASFRGGKTYLFHNTILQPVQSGYANPRGMGGGVVDNGGGVLNVYSRNNIWQTYKSDHPCIGEWQTPSGNGNTYDYDLYNNSTHVVSSSELGSHMINGSPTYAIGTPQIGNPNAAGYFLASGSKGVDQGQVLANFNDGFTGSAPDVGAYETGSTVMQYGVNAYLGTTPPPPPVNQPPTVTADADQVITLPNNTIVLTAIGKDADGTIVSYTWTQVSGPAGASFSSTTSAGTTISGLTKGAYVFRVTVTDDKGANATDDVKVTVNDVTPPPPPVNKPPVVNAGPDKIIYVPTSTVTLSGIATDSDGSVSSLSWSKVSGPAVPMISSPSSAVTSVSGLTKGSYVFRLTATDNQGASAFDEATVDVLDTTTAPPPPPPPPCTTCGPVILKTVASVGYGKLVDTLDNIPVGATIIIATTAESSGGSARVTSNQTTLKFSKLADASANGSGDAEVYAAVNSVTKRTIITVNWINSQYPSPYASVVIYVFQGAVNVSAKKTVTFQSLPLATITTTKPNSLIIGVTSDWRAIDGTTRSYRDAVKEVLYASDANHKNATFYHYTKVAAGVQTYTEGLRSPAGMQASTILIVIDGN